MNKMFSFLKTNKSVALSSLLFVCLFLFSSVTMADDLTGVMERGTQTLPSVAKFFIGVFFVLAVFSGGMFGYKIYQHGKDAREHKLGPAFIYLIAAACLIGAGYFVSTAANTIGVSGAKSSTNGDYSSFGQ